MGLLILLALGLLLLWAGMVAATAWMLTHPPRRTYASAVARARPGDPSELDEGRPFETWTFHSRGTAFPVWDIPGDAPSGPIIILIHGWADSRIGGLARVPCLALLASRLILFDQRGHGETPGISRLGTAEADDVLALLDHLGRTACPVLFGWSMGAGVALAAAAQHPAIAAVIAESPYRFADTPARNVLKGRGMPWQFTLRPALAILNLIVGGQLASARFDRARLAARAKCPILILHGQCDEVCPAEDGRQIAAAAKQGHFTDIPGGRHNDLWTGPQFAEQCATCIQTFLSQTRAVHHSPQ
jgi:uncharacterized protein